MVDTLTDTEMHLRCARENVRSVRARPRSPNVYKMGVCARHVHDVDVLCVLELLELKAQTLGS